MNVENRTVTPEQQEMRNEYLALTIADEIEALEGIRDLDDFQTQVLEALKNPHREEQQTLRDRYIELRVEREIAALEGMDDLDDFEQEVLSALKAGLPQTDTPVEIQPALIEPQPKSNPILGLLKHTLFGLQEGKCNGCEVLFPFRNMTVDHIHPCSKGGTDDPDNLQLLCAACNSTKDDRTQAYLMRKLKEQGVLRE